MANTDGNGNGNGGWSVMDRGKSRPLSNAENKAWVKPELPASPELPERFNVLLIDAQNDFADDMVDYKGFEVGAPKPIGRLPVTGAGDDLRRIAKFLIGNRGRISGVYASMDTHTVGHVGHYLLRRKDTKAIIDPSVVVTATPDGRIMGMHQNKDIEFEANVTNDHIAAMNRYLVAYIRRVEEKRAEGRTNVNTWNTHCIEGTQGWHFHPAIAEAFKLLLGKVQYFVKGQNQLAEMYSIFQAEVPYEKIIPDLSAEDQKIIRQYVYNPTLGGGKALPDPVANPANPNAEGNTFAGQVIPPSPRVESDYTARDKTVFPRPGGRDINLSTEFNEQLFLRLTAGGAAIVVCGEALSHCVQFSARDLLEQIKAKGLSNKVILLEGGSSPVVLPDAKLTAEYMESAMKFIADMKSSMYGTLGTTSVVHLNDDGSISGGGGAAAGGAGGGGSNMGGGRRRNRNRNNRKTQRKQKQKQKQKQQRRQTRRS